MKYAKIFVPVLIILGLLYFFLEKKPAEKEPGVFGTIGEKYQLKADEIDKIELSNADKTLTLAKVNESWKIESLGSMPADTAKIDGLIEAVLQDPIHRILAQSEAENPSEYGLDKSTSKITLYGKNAPLLDLTIGDMNSTGTDLYIMKGGAGEIILAGTQLKDILNFNPSDFRSKNPFQIDAKTAQSIVFTYPDKVIKLEKNQQSGTWQITEPEPGRAQTSKIERLIGQLKSMQITKFLGKQFPAEDSHGLAAPPIQVEVISDINGAKERVSMMLGDTNVEENSIYARISTLPGEDVLVEASIQSKLKVEAGDLKDTNLFVIDPAQVESVDVREPGADNLSIFKKPDGEWQMLKPRSEKLSEAEIERLFKALADLRPSKSISKEELADLDEEQTGLSSYKVKIVVKRKGADEFSITIGKLDRSQGYYVMTSDMEGACIVPENQVKTFVDTNNLMKSG